jgi:3-oxoacyl-[acyl-carrier-protein] synthase-3
MPVASTGLMLQLKLGLQTFGFDLQAACSSFYTECLLRQHIQSGKYKKLLIGADKMFYCRLYRPIYLYNFGDGAGAVLFEPNYEGLGLQDEYFEVTV